VIVGHVLGMPVEESVLQLVPAGAAVVTAAAIAGRVTLTRLRRGHNRRESDRLRDARSERSTS
jgi:hypothetical protein